MYDVFDLPLITIAENDVKDDAEHAVLVQIKFPFAVPFFGRWIVDRYKAWVKKQHKKDHSLSSFDYFEYVVSIF